MVTLSLLWCWHYSCTLSNTVDRFLTNMSFPFVIFKLVCEWNHTFSFSVFIVSNIWNSRVCFVDLKGVGLVVCCLTYLMSSQGAIHSCTLYVICEKHKGMGGESGCEGRLQAIVRAGLWNCEFGWSGKFMFLRGKVREFPNSVTVATMITTNTFKVILRLCCISMVNFKILEESIFRTTTCTEDTIYMWHKC